MSVSFTAELKKFASQGEKTGWTYITVPQKIADKIKPDTKRSFRVKGKIDSHPLKGVAMIPMGGGDFLIAINAEMRKAIRKQKGAKVKLELEEDVSEYKLSEELMICLEDEPKAKAQFNSLLPSHKRYYSKWIESAKTEQTRAKRIAMTIHAMENKIDFGEMLKLGK